MNSLHGVARGRGAGSRAARVGGGVDEVHRAEAQQPAQHDAGADRAVAGGHHHRTCEDDADDLGGHHRSGLELHPVADAVVDGLRDEHHVQGENGRDEQLHSHVDHLPGTLERSGLYCTTNGQLYSFIFTIATTFLKKMSRNLIYLKSLGTIQGI